MTDTENDEIGGLRAFTNDEIAEIEGLRAEIRAIDDAPVERYRAALAVLRGDPAQGAARWPKEIRGLVNVITGVWDAFEIGLRQEISNTNYVCVRDKLMAVESLLASKPACCDPTPQAGTAQGEPDEWQYRCQYDDGSWTKWFATTQDHYDRVVKNGKIGSCRAEGRLLYAAPPSQAGMREALETLRQPQYIIEGIILRRLHEKRIEGYTIEMAKEIADALSPSHSGQRNETEVEPIIKMIAQREALDEHRRETATPEKLRLARLLHRAAFPERQLTGDFDPAPVYLAQAFSILDDAMLRSELDLALGGGSQ